MHGADYILFNKSGIEFGEDFLNRIFKLADLPKDRLLLIFHNGPLFSSNLGITVPRKVYFEINDSGFFLKYKDKEWDCGIAFSSKACQLFNQFPAYFVYLIGHEFGHAHICLQDEALHVHLCLIQDFIKEASNERISSWHELPHEILFDKYGIFIAGNFYSRDQLNLDIEEMLKEQDCKDRLRLEQMLEQKSTNDLSGLRESLVKFSLPYKNELIELWKEDHNKKGSKSLASFINDYDQLFEY